MIYLIYNSHIKTDNYNNNVNSLFEELKNYGKCEKMPSSRIYFGSRFDLTETHGIVFWDKDISLLRYLKNIPTINSVESLTLCDDKGFSLQAFYENKVPVPKSMIVPEHFALPAEEEILITIEKEFTYPLILKERSSSYGMGINMIKNRTELVKLLNCDKKFIVQEYIENKPFYDIRVYIVGDKVLGGIKRINEKFFITNIEKGGRPAPHELNDDEKALALAAKKACRADVCGVDIIYKKGKPLVLEVNACAGFTAFDKISGLSVEKEIAKFAARKFKLID